MFTVYSEFSQRKCVLSHSSLSSGFSFMTQICIKLSACSLRVWDIAQVFLFYNNCQKIHNVLPLLYSLVSMSWYQMCMKLSVSVRCSLTHCTSVNSGLFQHKHSSYSSLSSGFRFTTQICIKLSGWLRCSLSHCTGVSRGPSIPWMITRYWSLPAKGRTENQTITNGNNRRRKGGESLASALMYCMYCYEIFVILSWRWIIVHTDFFFATPVK